MLALFFGFVGGGARGGGRRWWGSGRWKEGVELCSPFAAYQAACNSLLLSWWTQTTYSCLVNQDPFRIIFPTVLPDLLGSLLVAFWPEEAIQ